MNRQANILFNIDSSISDRSLALQDSTAPHSYYQRLINSLLARNLCTNEGFQSSGRQLAEIARHAYFARQIATVEQASQIMFALPISKELKAVALYYQAICTWKQGQADEARRMLERVTEASTSHYRAQALLTIGATYFGQGKTEAALPFYLAAGQVAGKRDLLTYAESQKMIAVVRSIYGDHQQALGDLERLFSLLRATGKYYPALYYDYLNSLAVELGEVGRLDEAKAACSTALASPFAAVYPEFAETRDELEAKRNAATPSIVAVSVTPESAPIPQAQAVHQAKPVDTLAALWLARKKSVLQTSIAIAPAIPLVESIQRIFNQMRFCIQPRGPPCRF
jgi:tetratricopeptide (TPR) repeat protein